MLFLRLFHELCQYPHYINSNTLQLDKIDIKTQSKASKSIAYLDKSLNYINIGANQSKQIILNQVGIAMLAQTYTNSNGLSGHIMNLLSNP